MSFNTDPTLFINSPLSNAPLNSDDFYQALVNAMGVGVLAVNTSGMTILANKSARENFGAYPGIHLNDVLPELWPKVVQRLRKHTHSIEVSVRGGEANYLVRVSPILLDKEQVGAVCVFVESTGLEEMAMQMQTFQELTSELGAIINSSSDGLWICDSQANVLRINPASERINHIKAEDVVGHNMRDLVAEGVFDKSATLEVLRTGNVANMLQQREGRKLILTGTPVFDTAGRLIRVVVSERDITEIDILQRELEEQEAMKDQFRHHMIEKQQVELESHRVIARSPVMLKALHQAIKVSTVDSSVLILGESGVGKGLIADLIHKNSLRAKKPLIKINCGAIPESLIESELFGYEKGAFTGAQAGGKPGYFELADGGTLFLDEIAELPLSSQVKLLRFLEDGRITRLGGTNGRTVDVRILAATHRNLEEMVSQGKFRLDLYYRLKVIPIYVPSVRERKDCILPLIHHYIDFFGTKTGIKKRLTRAASDILMSYPYPGNVRELMNICERLVVMSEMELIDLKDLPGDIVARVEETGKASMAWPEEMSLQQAIDSVERNVLAQAVERYGNQCRMAEVLGVNQSTIARKLKKYGLT
ncbi:sigma-54-dependent Fis family transcriptional regulator [Geotalea uraniireducens]|uniref:HTH-type transcriptional regulatory protein TyrR n=1 Tax=Geotalea uraniireducens (strain Rf4) TaxID=351605 RepID=A5GDL0_GEOUR|nr:sigma-54-dependent Fis family transcriptional regulator [Geotalea uraniireducens]ABQ24334.1 sigma-54 specific transcriptional regulator, Fis family [Geotalea uraniireducens Rf4]